MYPIFYLLKGAVAPARHELRAQKPLSFLCVFFLVFGLTRVSGFGPNNNSPRIRAAKMLVSC